ncbi:MAG: NIPSNAP family protein [Gammaproteobacteria bacterium]|nr:NIPSNAP family protein [Gammaproteobacteria bacterium]
MFEELRQYKIREGKMDAWVEFMETVIIPFQVSKGMVITGSYRGEDDDTLYVWTRRFDSEADRERLYGAVYNSDTWRDEIAPTVGELMDGPPVSVQRIVSTPRSPAQ